MEVFLIFGHSKRGGYKFTDYENE